MSNNLDLKPRLEVRRPRVNLNQFDIFDGAAIATAGEEADSINRLKSNLFRELRPSNMLSQLMLGQFVVMNVRTQRCARHERALISASVRDSDAKFDDVRSTEVERLIGWLLAEPETNVRKLQTTPEGTDRLLNEWTALLDDLDGYVPSQWSFMQGQKAEALMGSRDFGSPKSKFYSLTDCARGNFKAVTVAAHERMDDDQKMAWARDRIRELIQAEISRLKEVRARFHPDDLAETRADYADLASFVTTDDASASRKYLIHCDRMMHKALEAYYRAEQAFRDKPDPGTTPYPTTDNAPVGSFCPEPAPPLGSFCPEPAPPLGSFCPEPSPPEPEPEPTPVEPRIAPSWAVPESENLESIKDRLIELAGSTEKRFN